MIEPAAVIAIFVLSTLTLVIVLSSVLTSSVFFIVDISFVSVCVNTSQL